MQYSGRAFGTINPVFSENDALKALVANDFHSKAQFIPDWSKFAVRCPTAPLALMLFKMIKESPKMPKTAEALGDTLDVSAYDNPAVKKFKFTLVKSETFETINGILPESIMMVGEAYDFKEYIKQRFPEVRYTDLIFNGGTVNKAAWVLPVSAQTEATGSLADFLEELGVTIDEVMLDDDDEDDEEEDEEGFVLHQAEEAGEDEDEE